MKAKTKKPLLRDQPVPEFFHPKDAPNGVVWHPMGGFGASPDFRRGTVHISVGGAVAEVTIAAAQAFEEQLKCAINCVCEKRPASSATGEQR